MKHIVSVYLKNTSVPVHSVAINFTGKVFVKFICYFPGSYKINYITTFNLSMETILILNENLNGGPDTFPSESFHLPVKFIKEGNRDQATKLLIRGN